MEKCKRCKKDVPKRKGYPIIDQNIYCEICFDFLKWKKKVKREKEKRNGK